MNYKKDIEIIANMFYEAIQKGTAPWMKTWEVSDFKTFAHNPITKTKEAKIPIFFVIIYNY